MYFSQFPTTNRETTELTNLTVRIEFISRIKNNTTLFEYIQIRNEQTPESIANEYYGDPKLHWIVMLINDIYSYTDWFMNDNILLEYVIEKYGEANIYSTHHTEDANGEWTNNTGPTYYPVTNYEYENRINEEKRKIKLIKRDYIPQILEEYRTELNRV